MNMCIVGVKRLVLIMEDEFQIGLLDGRIFDYMIYNLNFTIWTLVIRINELSDMY